MDSTTTLPIGLNRALRGTLAVVLAGGRGSRLMHLTEAEAKPAMPFGGKLRIIDFSLSNCINSGVRRIAVVTQYKSHTLIQHVQRGWGFFRAELNEFVELWPAQQQTSDETWYLGTADAVFQNLDTIQRHQPTYVLILAGDHVYKQDYGKMLAQHLEREADITIACVEVERTKADQFGVVHVDDKDNVVGFLEKPKDPPGIPGDPDHSLCSMGVYIFSADFLVEQLQRDARDPDSSHDFGKDIIPYVVGRHKVIAHRFGNSCVSTEGASEPYWRDVGTIDAYWEANLDLTKVTPDLDLYDPTWPIWTYQVQSPPAKFVFDDDERRGVAVDAMVSAGVIVSGATVRRSVLFSNVRVNSYSLVEDCVVLPNCDIGRHSTIKRAIIDSNCMVPPGLTVGEDAALDANRFYRSETGITLITRRMLQQL